MNNLLTSFQKYLLTLKLSLTSRKLYLSDIRRFLSYLGSEPTLDQLTSATSYTHYLDSLKSLATAPSMMKRTTASLKQFASFITLTYGVQNPMESTKSPIIVIQNNYIKHFCNYLNEQQLSNLTIKSYKSDITRYLDWAGSTYPSTKLVELLSDKNIKLYLNHLADSLTSLPSTIERKMQSITRFKAWYIEVYLKNNETDNDEIVLPPLPSTYTAPTPANSKSMSPTSPEKTTNPVKKNNSRKWLSYLLPNFASASVRSFATLVVLLLFTSTLAIFGYRQFSRDVRLTAAFPNTPVAPNRQLSFQGRLENAGGTPITAATNLTFKLWDDATVGTQLYSSGVCSLTPDTDGVFSTQIGSTCGSGIPANVFTENADVWLEVTVESETLAPRQPIASVAYALNSETIQGFPISSTVSAIRNTVVPMNQWGEIIVGEQSPRLKGVSGTFQISAPSLSLITATGTNGNITLAPDGTGQVNLNGNTTTTNFFNVSNAQLTTGSLITGTAGNNNTGFKLIDLFSGSTPTSKFSVDYAGNTIIGGTLTLPNSNTLTGVSNYTQFSGGVSVGGGTTYYFNNTGDINANAATFASTLTANGTFNANGTVNLGDGGDAVTINGSSLTLTGFNCTGYTNGGTLTTDGSGVVTCANDDGGSGSGSSNWQSNLGALSPINSTWDVLVGGTATSSAKAGFINISSGTPTATVSAGTSGAAYLTAGGNLATTNMLPLTIGGSTTGAITLKPKNNVGLFINDSGNLNVGSVTTPNAQLQITGSSDEIQAIIKANATQTTNLQEWQSSSGSTLSSINSLGNFGIGTPPMTDRKIYAYNAVTDPAYDPTGIKVETLSTITSNNSQIIRGQNNNVAAIPASGITQSGALRGLQNTARNTGAGTVSSVTANWAQILNTSTGTITNAYNSYLETPTNSGGGSITNSYGLYIANQNTATNNYAILTNAGNIVFNQSGDASTDFRVEGDTDQNLFFTDASTDRVGIGNAAPTAKLDVTGGITLSSTLTANGDTILGDASTDNLTFNGRVAQDSDLIPITTTGTNDLGSAALPWDNLYAGNITLPSFTQGSVIFAGPSGILSQDNSNFYFDDTNNRFGIGVSSNLLAALDVRSTLGTIPSASISGITSKSALVVDQSGIGDIFTASKSGATKFVVTNAGNVGIGVAAPTYKLEVGGDTKINGSTYFASGTTYYVDSSGNAKFLDLQVADTGNPGLTVGNGSTGFAKFGSATIGDNNANYLSFDTNSDATDEFRIYDDGSINFKNVSSVTNTAEGSLYYDTDVNHLYLSDGTTSHRLALDMTKYSTNSAGIANSSYIEIAHNQNTNDLTLTGWFFDTVTNLWTNIKDKVGSFVHNLGNQFNPTYTQKAKTSTVAINYNENDLGTGADGSITVSSDTSINSSGSLIAGRSCADGGDAVNYNVTALTSTTATLESTPNTGCLSVGDEVLLINLQGGNSNFVNVGNYETLHISSISTNTITFTTAKSKYYGTGASDDTGIGTSAGSQIVMLQRVPNYVNVTVSGSGTDFTPDDWVSPNGGTTSGPGEGGVMFFRATGTVTIGSGATINATGKGYIGGAGVNQTTTIRLGGNGGESICGAGGAGGTATSGSAGAGGGGAGGVAAGTGGTGYCGGGGGGAETSGAGGTGSSTSGGSGGGGGGIGGAGGGGGYGAGAIGGAAGVSAGTAGANGGTNSSGNGGTGSGGGGGGGSYGESELTHLFFGSSGASGSVFNVITSGAGGDGGGIVYIAGNTVTNSGTLAANGSDGAIYTSCTAANADRAGGSGGGAGGSIKIVGNSVTLGSTTTADNGAGGDGCNAGASSTNDGGAGSDGRIAVYYSTSYSSTSTTPTPNTYTLSYYTYSTFVSKEIETPNATAYGNLTWTESLPTGSNVQFQTRSGATADSTDGTWEAWKPATVSTNYVSLNTMDTPSDFTATNNNTPTDGDVTRNVNYYEDEDEFTAGNTTKFGSVGSASGYNEATLSSTNLSGYDYLTAWVYATSSGNLAKIGIGESAGNEQEETITIDTANTWQKIYWDISDITGTSRDAITKLRFSLTQKNTTLYVDNVKAEKALLTTPSGSVITSTANKYLQYRAILTATNTSYQPIISAVGLSYTNPTGTYTIDASSVRNLNDANYYSSDRLQVTETQLNDSKSIHTQVGSDNISQLNSYNPGTGADGSITVSSDTSINATSLIAGRSCADGGDAVNYNVTALTSTTATLESTPSTGCLSVGDEVLLINLQGSTASTTNVGNNETLTISSLTANTITFTTAKTKYYGAGSNDDSSIGTSAGSQIVMLQRVPNYVNVTVSGSGTDFTPDDWVSPNGGTTSGPGEGGVMFFRASGTVTIGSGATINATGKGYLGGTAVTQTTNVRLGGYGGESICGAGGAGGTALAGGAGAAGGGAGGVTSEVGGTGYCGGGGGAGEYSSTGGGIGSTTSGGSGGGGGALGGGGGGGGYGAGGAGGNGNGAGTSGSDGGTNSSGNGGTVASVSSSGTGGGGGGSYGESELTHLFFGSSGGSGSVYNSATSGSGGDGGGIIYIATNALTNSGTLAANGSDGGTGNINCAASDYSGGGGSGAGGSIKIVGNSVTLGATTTADNGAAGDGCYSGASSTNDGGAGSDGRIAVYYASSYSSTSTTPVPTTAAVSTNNYAIFVSDEIPTKNATELNKLTFNFDENQYGMVQLQTRTGKSSNATDGSWEAWKPNVADTNIKSLNTGDTHTDWSSTNLTIADGDITRNVDEFEDEDESTVGNTTKISGTSSNFDTTSLTSYWSLGETSAGSVAVSRNDSYGTNTLTDNNTVPSTTGKVGTGASFTSANSEYLSCTDATCGGVGSTGLDFSSGFAGSWSWGAWFKTSTSGTKQVIISKKNVADDTSSGYSLYLDSSNKLNCRVSGQTVKTSTATYTDGAWHHAMCTYITGGPTPGTRLYIDGTIDGSQVTGGVTTINSTTDFMIGAEGGLSSGFFNGQIDEVGVWKTQLSAAQISALYNSGSGTTYVPSGSYAEATISATDLSNYDLVSFWVYSQTSGNVIKLGLGESAGNEQEESFYIDATNKWQKLYWDISDIDPSLRNSVTKLRVTQLTNSANTFYIDNIKAERLINTTGGQTISSTPGDFIQYRAILTTTNQSFRPKLYNVKVEWNNGFKIVQTDANTVRLYNSSGETQQLRLDAVVFGADLAEWYTINDDSIGAGDLVALTGQLDEFGVPILRKANSINDSGLVGAISTKAGQTLGIEYPNRRLLALAGRIPVKIDPNSPSFATGAELTSASLPGYATLALPGDRVIGKATESWNTGSAKSTITILIDNSYAPHATSLKSQAYRYLWDTKELLDQTTNRVITQVGLFNQLVSPSIQTAQISPLASNQPIAINGRVVIANQAPSSNSSEPLLTVEGQIDAATISARVAELKEIKADQITAGSIVADTIEANHIIGLDAKIASLSGQISDAEVETITDRIKNRLALLTGTAPSAQDIPLPEELTNSPSVAVSLGDSVTASNAATLASADIDFATINNYLAVVGQATITNLDVTSHLYTASIDSKTGTLALANNTLLIDQTGQVAINGDLTVSGKVLADSADFGSLSLGTPRSATSSALGQLLAIYDEQGQAVATIDASGSANLASLTTSMITIASAGNATSSSLLASNISTNATAGESTLVSPNTELTVESPYVTANSLVYLTPTGNTDNKVVFVKSKTTCNPSAMSHEPLTIPCTPSFTVAIDSPASSDISFNWWIIQLK